MCVGAGLARAFDGKGTKYLLVSGGGGAVLRGGWRLVWPVRKAGDLDGVVVGGSGIVGGVHQVLELLARMDRHAHLWGED